MDVSVRAWHAVIMVPHFCAGAIIFAVTAVFAAADIDVRCLRDSVSITWKIRPDLVPYASRFFLGSCMPSKLNKDKEGGGEVEFHYRLNDCKFKKWVKGKRVIYSNDLTFRPQARTRAPADYTYPIRCVYKRPQVWFPQFLVPGLGSTEGHGGLIFHMALLNEYLTDTAETNVITLGSTIPIWAAVEQQDHQPLLLLMEECVAAATPDYYSNSEVYPIITNHGCLEDGKRGSSMFLPRNHSSELILLLKSFTFALGEEVYIHCKLVAWDPQGLNRHKKACNYHAETDSWELLDDPYQNGLCSCCETSCESRSKRAVDAEPHGLVQNAVLGPLIIVDQSAVKSNHTALQLKS